MVKHLSPPISFEVFEQLRLLFHNHKKDLKLNHFCLKKLLWYVLSMLLVFVLDNQIFHLNSLESLAISTSLQEFFHEVLTYSYVLSRDLSLSFAKMQYAFVRSAPIIRKTCFIFIVPNDPSTIIKNFIAGDLIWASISENPYTYSEPIGFKILAASFIQLIDQSIYSFSESKWSQPALFIL